MAKAKEPQTGTFAAPPPDAPRETTAPLESSALNAQLAMARANERTLAPFSTVASPTTMTTGAVAPVATPPTVDAVVAPAPAPVVAPPAPPARVIHPAGSDTDSPSRGIPRPIDDPGKAITGGFGTLGEAQYFPLDGTELKALVRKLLGAADRVIENDLRFSIAVTYPRVTVRVKIEVEGYAESAQFSIERMEMHDKTPEDVAAERAQPVHFEVSYQRREFDEAGEPENPPDRLRDEMGIQKPRKQFVQAGAQRMIVDSPASLDGSF